MSPSLEPVIDCDCVALRAGALRNGPDIRESLVGAGYTPYALASIIGLSSPDERQDVELVFRRVRADSPFNILVRLFWLGHPVCEKTLRGLVPRLDVEGLISTGLLLQRDGDVCSTAKLAPYHDLFMASDFGFETRGRLHADHVLGVGAASQTLAGMTVRRKVGRALDLGSGAGIQAFLAARHADRVIGTDVSSRALAFAEFNARLNAISNVQWRRGSLYEPLGEEVFDLIVSNPPFVISPESSFTFRDGGQPADTLSQQVIQKAAPRLTDGGFACILFNWYHQDDSDWAVRPGEWVAGTGCDALVICFKSTDALPYAADWLRNSLGPGCPEYGRRLDEWAAYYERTGVVRISAGAMILRHRPARSNWFSARRMGSARCVGPCGEQIERIFAAEDLLADIKDDRELLRHRYRLSDDHELTHELKISEGQWVLTRQTLHNRMGIPFSGDLDIVVTELLARCDRHATLVEAITAVAGSMELNSEELQPACLVVIRKLLQSGLLHVCTGDRSCEDGFRE
ncbi:MAG: methyltransferase [Phycisphaerales bacterium]